MWRLTSSEWATNPVGLFPVHNIKMLFLVCFLLKAELSCAAVCTRVCVCARVCVCVCVAEEAVECLRRRQMNRHRKAGRAAAWTVIKMGRAPSSYINLCVCVRVCVCGICLVELQQCSTSVRPACILTDASLLGSLPELSALRQTAINRNMWRISSAPGNLSGVYHDFLTQLCYSFNSSFL